MGLEVERLGSWTLRGGPLAHLMELLLSEPLYRSHRGSLL
jgi:hypothetical protein